MTLRTCRTVCERVRVLPTSLSDASTLPSHATVSQEPPLSLHPHLTLKVMLLWDLKEERESRKGREVCYVNHSNKVYFFICLLPQAPHLCSFALSYHSIISALLCRLFQQIFHTTWLPFHSLLLSPLSNELSFFLISHHVSSLLP